MMYRPKNASTPKCVPGDRVPTQPFNPLGQLFCALLDISKWGVVIDGEWLLFGGSIHGSGELDGIAKPGLRRLFVRWRDASESQQLPHRGGRV